MFAEYYKNRVENYSKFETEFDVNGQLTSLFETFVISLYLSVCVFPLSSDNYSYLY